MPPRFGGAPKCPKCEKSVYHAEEMLALAKSWHKMCFKCDVCNKLLDSTNASDHEGRLFCKACYGKEFGPKGYGFCGGAAGLSTDPGKLNQGAEKPRPGGTASNPLASKFGGGEKCGACGKTVYAAERVPAAGKVYHKACFACSSCRKALESTTVTDNEGVLYCKSCYGKNFGPKGFGFGQGAGALSLTE